MKIIPTGSAMGYIEHPAQKGNPVTVIGTEKICRTFDEKCIEQALNCQAAPGVSDVVLNPDAHCGYGAPVGCVLVSPTHIYPGPVGVDIKCSMSLLQLDLPEDAIRSALIRREIIHAILERTPTGAGKGQRSVKKSRPVNKTLGIKVVTQGASREVCEALGIPSQWAERCEDAYHLAHDHSRDTLIGRLDYLTASGQFLKFEEKIQQLGSYGSGNHFGECEIVRVADNQKARDTAEVFGLKNHHVAFLSHCGSRGFGFHLAKNQFQYLQGLFQKRKTPFPAGDKELVYAPIDSAEGKAYLDDMAIAGNFATVNHLLINALVLEAFQQVIPGVKGRLVYFISHNIARKEPIGQREYYVHRKGATRAFPAGHPGLANTPFAKTGHPILLPGNPRNGSAVMVAEAGAAKSCFSVNHGAGRIMGRRRAIRELNQQTVNDSFKDHDILTNCRNYPKDEAPDAYKDFEEVLRSVENAGLAKSVARLEAKFVIKDQDIAYGGAA
ncbi:MAG: RtcB family protein [Candidatus Omnitrophica bacterium]|nr:RtcB family protein [Candidatus Omnitrophota bacterium]